MESKTESRNSQYTGDKPREKHTLERVREWIHKPKAPEDGYCFRDRRPAHTPPWKAPGECHGCGVNDWKNGGVIERVKETKQVTRRGIDPTKP